MAGPQQRQQVIDDRPDLAEVGLDVREGRRADRQHDVLRGRGVGRAVGELEPAGGPHPVQQLLGPGLGEGHPAIAQRIKDGRVVVDAQHPQPAVGEAEGQG